MEVRPGSSRLVRMGLSDFQALVPYTTSKSFIRTLLNPKPTRRLTVEEEPLYIWLTSFVVSTEYDLYGLRENFDPPSRWRRAIGTARACPSSRKLLARTTRKRINWHAGLTMMIRPEAKAGRRRGARRLKQTKR
jgi:hypothetical protein